MRCHRTKHDSYDATHRELGDDRVALPGKCRLDLSGSTVVLTTSVCVDGVMRVEQQFTCVVQPTNENPLEYEAIVRESATCCAAVNHTL